MPEVRRRRTTTTRPPVNRRRDRAREEEAEEEEEEDDRRRRPAARAVTRDESPRRRVVNRHPVDEEPEGDEPEEDEDDDAELDDDAEEEDDAEEVEEARPRPRSTRRAPAPAARQRTTRESRRADRPSRGRTTRREGPPPGIGVGLEGTEELIRSGGGAGDTLRIDNHPQLIKCLENPLSGEVEPFGSVKIHWVEGGGGGRGRTSRPYTCWGDSDCPLCKMGAQPTTAVWFNVLKFSEDADPELKTMKLGVRAWNSFKDIARDRKQEKVFHFGDDFFTVQRSGEGQQSQTTFRRLKERDVQDDWPEIADSFDFEELDDYIEDLQDQLKDHEKIPRNSLKELRSVAKYLADDDDEE